MNGSFKSCARKLAAIKPYSAGLSPVSSSQRLVSAPKRSPYLARASGVSSRGSTVSETSLTSGWLVVSCWICAMQRLTTGQVSEQLVNKKSTTKIFPARSCRVIVRPVRSVSEKFTSRRGWSGAMIRGGELPAAFSRLFSEKIKRQKPVPKTSATLSATERNNRSSLRGLEPAGGDI